MRAPAVSRAKGSGGGLQTHSRVPLLRRKKRFNMGDTVKEGIHSAGIIARGFCQVEQIPKIREKLGLVRHPPIPLSNFFFLIWKHMET